MPLLPMEEPLSDSDDLPDVPPEVSPAPELPLPDMPVHAPSSIAHAIGIIHLIIIAPAKIRGQYAPTGVPVKCMFMHSIEADQQEKFGAIQSWLISRKHHAYGFMHKCGLKIAA